MNVNIQKSGAKLITYSNQVLPNAGKTNWKVDAGKEMDELTFELVNNDVVPVLGFQECVELSLAKRIEIVNNQELLDEYAYCFAGIGCLTRNTP